ncbi:hypothetical protein ACDH60_14980 [Pseudomonas ficuserectae]|uniref:4Fe-4S ferredoxin-type domain-containing protein n=2 Tax=Pseudomonas amygdali pv. lachrymans TaxID=53707 RepID=A0AB37R370_PSEAV|nr:hypothetical protein [Pseudomonas amygdali]AXH57110.1 hypothetical protein PLA107_018760 [Pseudomonas amygdali pv. lachrymans str. M301315]KKY55706.1 hypothetical protein AAY85_23350 [Pseudomonas amygdali pv. lachrymans]KPB98996.1 Uncharacterized protein AC501_3979 [Pseudomonas amygdali pv. lachrymans]KPC16536.1 Uncharacterized protein AC499_6414 [Pseudomonas amygdali pv. lachrymans]PWD03122.1 hypothetical protein CX658_12330 [Pseudomonas amygdali pv. lachrymans]
MSKESNMVPRCENCGYTEKDCREQMDNYLCGFPEPAAAPQAPVLDEYGACGGCKGPCRLNAESPAALGGEPEAFGY